MALLKTKGLIIKEVPFNDTDKMLTMITKDLGKISVSAKNSRRSGSRTSYGTQVLTYGEYVLFRGKTSYTINSCDVLANYYDLAANLTSFTYAAHMLEMAEDVARDPGSCAQILSVLLYGLQALRKGRNPILIASAFSLKLMQIAGYPPHITSCVSCDTRDIEKIRFSFKECGFLCEECAKTEPDSIPVDVGQAKAMMHVLCADNSAIFNFELSEQILRAFSSFSLRYIEEQMDKKYRKLDFLKEI